MQDWEEIEAQIRALSELDKKRQATSADVHDYVFEEPEDAAGIEAWHLEHGDWLDRELRVFGTIEELFKLCPTMAEFRTGFLIREPEMPFATRLCSFWNTKPPSQYRFEDRDPAPNTVQFRWLESQYKRQRTRLRFQGGLGGLLRMFPRKRVNRG